jgi:hypothetical protein
MSLPPANSEGRAVDVGGPQEWVPFNVNEYIRFKITAKGRQMLREKFAWLASLGHENVETVLDSLVRGWRGEDWIEMQMWCFMETFGAATHIGFGGNFETKIEIQIRQRRGEVSEAPAGGKP